MHSVYYFDCILTLRYYDIVDNMTEDIERHIKC